MENQRSSPSIFRRERRRIYYRRDAGQSNHAQHMGNSLRAEPWASTLKRRPLLEVVLISYSFRTFSQSLVQHSQTRDFSDRGEPPIKNIHTGSAHFFGIDGNARKRG